MKVFLMLVGGLLVMPLSAMAKKIRLEAGAVDRRDSLVELDEKVVGALPAVYRTSGGDVLQVQRSEGGVGHVVLPELAAGEVVTLEPVDMKLAEMVAAERDGSRIVFRKSGSVDPRELLTYQAEAGDLPSPEIDELYRRGGYLHPLVTPGGKMVSADFPPGHVHHHGVWFAWTSTEFQGRKPDFWNMGTGSAKVEFVSLDRFSGGTVFGELVGRHRYVDLGVTPPVTALNEQWRLRVLPPGGGEVEVNRFDLVVRQECATEDVLKLPTYHYGGLGYRGNQAWNGAGNLTILTSEGLTDRVKANTSRARWCYVGGKVDGKVCGAVILCHSKNFRFPQPIRVHPEEPFFCFAPSQLGEWTIEPGKEYVSSYRFLVMDGEPDREVIERHWRDYVEPVKVVVE